MPEKKPRRSKGTGSVHYDAAHQRWIGQPDLGYRHGRRYRPKVYGRTQRDAQQKVAKLLLEYQGGRAAPIGRRENLNTFLTRWLETSQRPTVEPSTYQSQEMIVRRHLAPALGHLRLDRLTTADVQQYIAAKAAERSARGTPLAPATVRLHVSTLRHALETAVDWGLMPRNPVTARVRLPKVPQRQYAVLDKAAGRRFLRLVAEERLAALYILGLTTGLRIGEALGLRWQDVDLDGAVLTVRQQLHHRKGGVVEEKAPKSEAGVREIDLLPLALVALRQHKAQQAAERLQCGAAWERADLVFTNPLGRPLWDRPISSYSLPKLLARASQPRLRFHDLRHAFATTLLSEGADLAAVSRLLGHANPAITMLTYRHVLPHEPRKAMDVLGAALEDPES